MKRLGGDEQPAWVLFGVSGSGPSATSRVDPMGNQSSHARALDDEFEQLFERYYPRVSKFFSRRGFSHVESEDLAQRTFLKAYRSWERHRRRYNLMVEPHAETWERYRKDETSWIFTIARNKAIDDARARARTAVVPTPEWNRFINGFGHLFAGGYAAGYYSYLWAELLSADAFSRFEEEGIFNRITGESLRDEILSMGGSRDAIESFVAFRGRQPEIGPMLRAYGIET